MVVEEGGRVSGISGLDIREEIWAAWVLRAGLATRSFLAARCESLSEEVGMDSGIGSDIIVLLSLRTLKI